MDNKVVVWQVAKYQHSGRDFSAEIPCVCEHRRMTLWGYNDQHFWKDVGCRIHIVKCKCGREREYIFRPFHLEYRWPEESSNGKA